MAAPDADRLAPVTYLPGVRPASRAHAPEEPASPVAWATPGVEPAMPVPVERRAPRAAVREPADADADAERARAERISMHALTRRGVSVSELRGVLRSRELPDEVVEHELDRLERVGLLDDAALAETLVRTLRERKKLGRAALTAELQRRGIAREMIAAAVDTQCEEQDGELERAIELATQRARQLRALDAATAQRRLASYLMRRGYSGGIVSAAVQRALGPEQGSGPVFR